MGGQCWAGNGEVYKAHGKPRSCPPNGKGYNGVVNVYRINKDTTPKIGGEDGSPPIPIIGGEKGRPPIPIIGGENGRPPIPIIGGENGRPPVAPTTTTTKATTTTTEETTECGDHRCNSREYCSIVHLNLSSLLRKMCHAKEEAGTTCASNKECLSDKCKFVFSKFSFRCQ